MNHNLQFSLSYKGSGADNHEIDFYDVSKALIGFQRSLALTAHLFANNEIITKAPYLKGARVVALPPEEGSWKITADAALGSVLALLHSSRRISARFTPEPALVPSLRGAMRRRLHSNGRFRPEAILQ